MRQNIRSMILQLLLIPLLQCLTPVLFAQSADTGAIFGTVTDKMGAVLPDAKVTVTNERTGATKTISTNSAGFYDFEALVSSDYSISITHDGFKTSTTQHILVNPGQRREVASQLEVGSISTSVTVESNPLQVKTETSDNSTTVASEEIATLLVNGRNFQSLATLVPGVNNTNGNNQYSGGGLTSSTSLAIGGSGIDNTTYEIDGVYNMNTGNYNNINITPSMDVISVFSVLKSNYSARYGTASSSVVLVDTKSGTKDYHGGIWNYFRNDAMDASSYDSNGVKTKLRQNVYGFSFGGPVEIPKLFHAKQTFFFASDEWWKRINGATRHANIITPDMRGGNLTGSRGMPAPTDLYPKGAPLSLTPTGTQLLAAQGKTNCIASDYTLNPACLDADALAILKTYQPQTPNTSNPDFNYVNNEPDTFSQVDHDYRIDHNFGPNESLTGRVMYEETNSFSPANTWGGGNVPTITQSIYTSGLNAMVRLTSSLTPTIVNTASIAETYDKPRLHSSNAPYPDGFTMALFYKDSSGQIPNVHVASYDNIGVGVLPVNASDGEGIVNDDITVVRGKHTLQAGGFYVFGIKNQITTNTPQGEIHFDGVYTGSGAADFLLGLHDYFNQPATKPHYSAHYRSTEFYVQDDWKVTPRLVVNAGVRFFYYSPDWLTGNGTDNLTSNFDFAKFDATQAPVVLSDGSFKTDASGTPVTSAGTAANLTNGLVYSPSAGVPRGFYDSTTLYTAPRVGFAYALTNDGRTSVHAGYGIGDTRVPFQIVNAFGSNPPGVTSVNFNSGTFEQPAAGAAATVVPRPQGLTLVNLKFRPSQFQNFSLIVEREVVHGAIFQVGYAGSLGRYLHEGIDANQVLPTSTPFANNCLYTDIGQTPSATYDYDPCLNKNLVSSDYLRPYKGWDGLTETLYSGNSSYNSLQSQFKYVKKSVQTTLNYTWSKSMGDSTNSGQDFRTEVSSTQNSYCIKCEYGVLNFDRTHMFTGNVIYELPIYAHGNNRLMKGALGGWSVSGIAIAQSGFALTPTMSNPNSSLTSRPNLVGKIHRSSDRNAIFNKDAFALPGYGFFGNASNGSLRGTKDVAFNTALYKTFNFTERANFQFRAEAFNLANHPNFTNANTGIGQNEPNFGRVNSPADPRILEVVGRFTF